MAMATEKHTSKWRNFMIWSAVGGIVYVLAVLGISSLRHEGVLGTIFKSEKVAALTGLGLILSAAWVGFSSRNSPISLRNVRKFLISSAVAVAICALPLWGFPALIRTVSLSTMGVSEMVAALLGLTLLIFALLFTLPLAAAHAGARFMPAESVAEVRRRGRSPIYSLIATAAMGLTLILLSFAGPGGALSPAVGLAVVLVLLAITTALSFAAWPLMDEMSHTISRETGNAAFYLILLLGGGWAMLAHLGFVAGPTPLDWLTMFALFMFVASFIAAARRGLFKR